MTQFMDGQEKSRIDFLLETSQPFTRTNTTLPPDEVHTSLQTR